FEDLFEDNLVDIPELSLTILGRAKASLELARAENYLDLDYSESLKSAQKDYRVLINNGIFGSDEEGDILDSFFKTYYLGGNFEDLVLNAKAIIDKNFNELSKENLGLIYSSIGMTYWTTNQNEKAIEFMKKALELNPTLENYSEYAVSLFQTGDYDNALIYFNKCVDESPNNTTYMNNRGEFYFQIGDYINAEKDFLKCLEIGENFDIDVMLSLLKISIKNNDYDMQLKYAHDIQESISLDALSNYWLYEVYYHQKRYVKAITYLSIALTIKKSSDVILVSYQNYENTIPEDNEIIDYSSIYFQRGNLFSDLGDDIEACKDYKTALSFIEESSQLSIELEKLILENCKK
ncbi:tetratricopeptide repeat protein, partial [Flavobacteriaceae bacterium]|nr:tetratricopeptide repeat protein [Flavobacteriaceae bacterium]